MPAYEVCYDLRQPGRNYEPLWTRLRAWSAVRVLESCWIVPEASSADALRNDLRAYIDGNDGLFIAGMTGETAWTKLMDSSDQFLLKKFAA